MPLTLDQIACLFDELKLPRALAVKGSPIDIVCPNESLHSRRDGALPVDFGSIAARTSSASTHTAARQIRN
jgi:hypothetical protein